MGLEETRESSEGALLYSARLRPNRSLSRRGRGVVLALLGLWQAVAGVVLALNGAWPASVFLVLTWLALVCCFRRVARNALAYEELALDALELRYARVNPRGRRRDWRFSPLWVRLAVERHEEFGVERLDLFSRGRRLEIGVCLGRGDKTRLAQDLSAALAQARRGPRFG
jgi:uncharacterized membrane protein